MEITFVAGSPCITVQRKDVLTERADVKSGGVTPTERLQWDEAPDLGNHIPSSRLIDMAKYNKGGAQEGKKCKKERKKITLKLETVPDKACSHKTTRKSRKNNV